MKKIVGGIGLLALAVGVLTIAGMNNYEAKALGSDYVFPIEAEYVSLEKAPIIDGLKEDVWKKATEIETDKTNFNVTGNVCVMWNETGLYFFAEVFEETVNCSDICNFWVSETFDRWNEQSYSERDGAYYLCLKTNGENAYYLPGSIPADQYVDMSGKYEVGTTYSEKGYTVEVYVPKMGEKELKLGGEIGFNVSIDDYLEENAQRDSFTTIIPQDYLITNNLFGEGYWTLASELAKMILGDSYADNGIAPGNESAFENSGLEKENNFFASCSSTVATLPAFMTACACITLYLRKKEE